MACPACGCKTTYTYDDEDYGPAGGDYERCAACGTLFDVEDHTPEDEEGADHEQQ